MATVITSPADIVNLALVRIGQKSLIGNLYDGSEAANLALNIYGQTRDELLHAGDPAFARRDVTLTLLKSAPVGGYIPPTVWDPTLYPPLPWAFEYGYPADCVNALAVRPVPLFRDNVDPVPNVFIVANDNTFVPARRVILSDVASAVMSYTSQLTDPATMPADFVEEFAAALGRRLAPALAGLEATKFAAGDEQQQTAVAALTSQD